MPNVMHVLKDEIVRLTRKELKGTVEPLRANVTALRKTVADLSRRMAVLEAQGPRVATDGAATSATTSADAPAGAPSPGAGDQNSKVWITAKGVNSLRRRLELTRRELGALAGVSESNVYLWERRKGPLRLRPATREALLALRTTGVREARTRLAALATKPAE